MTDFRAKGTIMGLAGLTAVFGMGTGVAPPVSSPENRPGGDEAPAAEQLGPSGHTDKWTAGMRMSVAFRPISPRWTILRIDLGNRIGDGHRGEVLLNMIPMSPARHGVARRTDRGGQAIGC